MLNRLEPVHKPLIVGWVYLIERRSGCGASRVTYMRVRLLHGVVIIAAGLFVHVDKRGFEEAQKQSTRNEDGVRATH